MTLKKAAGNVVLPISGPIYTSVYMSVTPDAFLVRTCGNKCPNPAARVRRVSWAKTLRGLTPRLEIRLQSGCLSEFNAAHSGRSMPQITKPDSALELGMQVEATCRWAATPLPYTTL